MVHFSALSGLTVYAVVQALVFPQTAPGPAPDTVAPASEALASASFERLKRLAGNWRGTAADTEAFASIQITARGSAIIERLVVEDPVEMHTVYYRDHGRLMLTHYCAAGNQPTMYLDAHSTADVLHFSFARGTNFRGADDYHMHNAVIKIAGDSIATWEWVSAREGKITGTDRVALRREQSRASADDFDFLEGNWTIVYNNKTPGIPPNVAGTWIARKQADGRVLNDEFRLFGPNREIVFLGVTYRAFDGETRKWNMRYVALTQRMPDGRITQPASWAELTAWRDGNSMRVDQRGGAFDLRITYYDIGPTHFSWKADVSQDGGRTWLKDQITIEATRVAGSQPSGR